MSATSEQKAIFVRDLGTYGFAQLFSGEGDVFVAGRYLRGAVEGDEVIVRTHRGDDGRLEGEILSIEKKSDKIFVGTLETIQGKLFIVIDGKLKFPVSQKDAAHARSGDRVCAVVKEQEGEQQERNMEIVASFGKADTAKACAQAMLHASGIPQHFPDEVIRQANEKARTVPCATGRLDLRDAIILTIDAAESKDLDDAVSVEKTPEGYRLGVHIADVSSYVEEGSPLDGEAFLRGTSLYYADQVIPMLPQALSNGICSLNPGEDRLCLSALMDLSQRGELVSFSFCKTIIRSAVKGVYREINDLLAGCASEEIRKKYSAVLPTVKVLQELASILRGERFARGGLDLDARESKIIVDESGRAVDVQPRERGESERIIEELMLKANEAAARFAREHNIPFVYRTHAKPSVEKLETLRTQLTALGIQTDDLPDDPVEKFLQAVLDRAKGTPLAPLIGDLVIRAQAKAEYSEEQKGHFGLHLGDYAHFTSPIRRYPDLAVHRMISRCIGGTAPKQLREQYAAAAAQWAQQSTETELRAMRMEYGLEDLYKAEYMTGHIGERFEGVITSCLPQGAYLQLANGVEGLIRADSLPAGMEYDGVIQFCNAQTGAVLRPGDCVTAVLMSASIETGKIDFSLA